MTDQTHPELIEATNVIYAEMGLPSVASEAESEALRDRLTTEQLILLDRIEGRIAERLEHYARCASRPLTFAEKITIVTTIAHALTHPVHVRETE